MKGKSAKLRLISFRGFRPLGELYLNSLIVQLTFFLRQTLSYPGYGGGNRTRAHSCIVRVAQTDICAPYGIGEKWRSGSQTRFTKRPVQYGRRARFAGRNQIYSSRPSAPKFLLFRGKEFHVEINWYRKNSYDPPSDYPCKSSNQPKILGVEVSDEMDRVLRSRAHDRQGEETI